MENTIENKAAFFALYWGQKVMVANIDNPNYFDSKEKESAELRVEINNVTLGQQWFLRLKSLKSITDEDAKVCLHDMYKEAMPNVPSYSKYYLEEIKVLGFYSGFETDYLRSKGYAMPFMGLSVEKMVEYGWIKLID